MTSVSERAKSLAERFPMTPWMKTTLWITAAATLFLAATAGLMAVIVFPVLALVQGHFDRDWPLLLLILPTILATVIIGRLAAWVIVEKVGF